jgi:hypothetical protein
VRGDRTDHDGGDNDQAERAEDVALAAQSLSGLRRCPDLARTRGRIHE